MNEENTNQGESSQSSETENAQPEAGTQQESAPVFTSPNEGGGQSSEEAQSDDIADHKVLAIVGYILPFLFFLPLVNDDGKKSKFARFHANQHLILLIALVGLYFLHNIFYMVFMMGGFFIMQLANIAFLILMIIGIINASQGKMKELPVIGKFSLLK